MSCPWIRIISDDDSRLLPQGGNLNHLTLTIPGEPIPQGSLQSGGRGQLFYSNAARLKPYRTAIATAVRDLAGETHEQWTGPVTVRALFVFQRPKYHFTSRGELKPTAPIDKLTPPDTDKLLRSVLDAITQSGVYGDDAQVVFAEGRKEFGAEAMTWLEIEHQEETST